MYMKSPAELDKEWIEGVCESIILRAMRDGERIDLVDLVHGVAHSMSFEKEEDFTLSKEEIEAVCIQKLWEIENYEELDEAIC